MRSALCLIVSLLLCGQSLAAEMATAEFGTMPAAVEDGHPSQAAKWRAVQANLARLAPRIRDRGEAEIYREARKGREGVYRLAAKSWRGFAAERTADFAFFARIAVKSPGPGCPA